jgi:hypothetical protein
LKQINNHELNEFLRILDLMFTACLVILIEKRLSEKIRSVHILISTVIVGYLYFPDFVHVLELSKILE